MKRGKKLLFLALAMVVMAAAALAAVKLSPEDDGETAEESVTVYSVDTDEVTKLSWTYNEETITLQDSGSGWMYESDRNFPLDESKVRSMLSALSEITAAKTIESPEDLDQYGLADPVCSITVTAGKTSEIAIGSESGLGGQRYLSNGDGNVYLVDDGVLDSFTVELYDLIQEESIPSMTAVRSFVVEDAAGTFTIDYLEDSGLAYSSHYTWFADTDSGYVTLDTELTGSFVQQITNLKWGKCVDYQATATALHSYGLDEPAATVTVTYVETSQVETNETGEDGSTVYETKETEQTFVLEIGGYTGSSCYARIAGSKMVYLIDASICDSLLHTALSDLLPDDVLVMDWDTVTGFDITVDGTTWTVKKEQKETTDDDGNTVTEEIFTCRGTEVHLDSVLSALESLNSTGSGEGLSSARSADIRFTFRRDADTFRTVELAFYPYDSSSCLVSLNGEMRLFVSRDSVVSIINDVKAALEG